MGFLSESSLGGSVRALAVQQAIDAAEAASNSALLAAGVVQEFLRNTLIKADAYRESPCLLKTGASTLSVRAGTMVLLEGEGDVVEFETDTPVTMPGTMTAGEDYAVFVQPDSEVVCVADPFTSPASPPVIGAYKIGGFHYSLTAPETTVAGGGFGTGGTGTISWTQPEVDSIAGINEYSIWDQTYRPVCDPRGMSSVRSSVDARPLCWFDIYFTNTNWIGNGSSRYNTDVASGTVLPRIPLPPIYTGDGSTNFSTYNWFNANLIAVALGKRLPNYVEFFNSAIGVNEQTSLGGSAVTIPATTRQAGFTSKFGGEQMTGHQWTLGSHLYSANNNGTTSLVHGAMVATGGMSLFGGARATAAATCGSRSIYGYVTAVNIGTSDYNMSSRFYADHISARG